MSAPTPEAAVLAMLFQRMKAPECNGWMLGSLLGQGKQGNGQDGLVVSLILFYIVT
jgi:hypothetical protein